MPAKQKKEDKSANTVLRKAYTTATQQLREAHRDEFEGLYTAAAKDLGLDRSPRPNAEQKAEAEFDALLAEYPHLRDRVAGAQEVPVEGSGEVA